MKHPIRIEEHYGIQVLRDDLLEGGTKSILIENIIRQHPHAKEFVYSSPVYGGFQIALSLYCSKIGKSATIFCAKRKIKHPNTLRCIRAGAKIVEVSPGYLSVVEKRAEDYCAKRPDCVKIVFGANTPENIETITKRATKVIEKLGREPDEIWVAVGSGTIVQGILGAVKKAKVFGVQVGAEVNIKHPQLKIIKYPLPFEEESKIEVDFPSMPNYDRKALEVCLRRHKGKHVLFWNVL